MPILDALLAARDVRVVGLITAPATPLLARGSDQGLPMLVPRSLRSQETVAAISGWRATLGVLADYGRIVPPVLIDRFEHGILNVHPSLLPRWRGASPIAATIAAGDSAAGVTVIALDAGLDTGPIVASTMWPLAGDEDAPALRAVASERGAALLIGAIGPWVSGRLTAQPQNEDHVTSTRPLTRDDGRLDGRLPAGELERLVRALRPWPGCFLETVAGRIIVWTARAAPSVPGDRPGLLVRDQGTIGLATIDGRLVFDEVQPAGGRRMNGDAFLRGRGRRLPGTEIAAARRMDRPWMIGA